jgi:hypothetical protein
MKLDELQSYQNVVEYLKIKNRQKHLLFGNGFSIAYDQNIFSYNALSKFIDEIDNDLLKKLFEVINTKNFELVMQQLDNFIEIAKAFSNDENLIKQITEANGILKTSLIEAVQKLHPEHVFKVPEDKSQCCHAFLNDYLSKGGKVFSTNYDLLPYWILMRNESEFAIDGFGKEVENPDEVLKKKEPIFSALQWGKHKKNQSIFYLHGALLIFDTGIEIEKETYDLEHYLLQKINERMASKSYPIFVTAGSALEKLNHISHNKYLSYCYDQLTQIEGSLITFGFNFGEYDTHIIDAINKAAHQGQRAGDKLHSLYIGVYSQENLDYIQSIIGKFRLKVNFYDASTAPIWEEK